MRLMGTFQQQTEMMINYELINKRDVVVEMLSDE